ncbi:MAG: histidine kinase, partial [Candidatus Riflebacteria bacterium]
MNSPEKSSNSSGPVFGRWWGRFWSFISLFPEFDHASMVNDPAGVLRAWRERALKILVFFTLLLKLPIVIKLLGSGSEVVPNWAIIAFLLLYIPSVLIVLIERIPIAGRTYLLMGLKVASGATQLVSTQLLGSGRLTLLMVTPMALILGGPVVAVHFVIICSIIIGLTIYLVSTGVIQPATVLNGIVSDEYLILQGKMWLVEALPNLYLMGHFLFLHERTLVAVSDARKELDAESEKNRRLELEMHRIAEQERQKLGAELHDGLCQHLTATLLKCSSLMYVLKEAEKPELEPVEKIRSSVEKSIALAYQVSRGLV